MERPWAADNWPWGDKRKEEAQAKQNLNRGMLVDAPIKRL
jgi:hypothetical protein